MESQDDEKLKDEIDKITQNIDTIMEKIKNIIPSPQQEPTESDEQQEMLFSVHFQLNALNIV